MNALPVFLVLTDRADEGFIADMAFHIGIEHLDAFARRTLHEGNVNELGVMLFDLARDRTRICCTIGERAVAVRRDDLYDILNRDQLLLIEFFPVLHKYPSSESEMLFRTEERTVEAGSLTGVTSGTRRFDDREQCVLVAVVA